MKTPLEILTEINEDVWDMSYEELRNFHGIFAINVFHSMQEVTTQDISNEFIIKHFELAKKFNKILKSDYYKESKEQFKND